ncbi:MAG TPA: hypothetical protein VGB45_09245 [Abditibacterium sp.]|jgi:hypothetical protein
MKTHALYFGLAALPALGWLAPAHAVVLEQKWQTGQNLFYQTALNGTANVQAPANAPFIFAGVPLEVEIQGAGLAQLQTLEVDKNGIGTVLMRVPKFDLQAQALGQKGRYLLSDASSKVTLNGKTLKVGDGKNPFADPKVAWRISRQGRFLGVKELEKPKVTAPEADDAPVAPTAAIDRSALLMASIIRALPTLWPGRDVQTGETWKANISWPTPSPTNSGQTTQTQFGDWNLTLQNTETVAGRALHRVAVKGNLKVDSAQFEATKTVNKAKPSGKTAQTVSGDLWFDAAAGQIVRADLVLGARVEGGQNAESQAWADFTGTLQLNLQNSA